MSNLELAVQFFLQLAVILVICRAVGLIAARMGQPQVVAEMIAGVILGPSVFGALFPEIQRRLFPWDISQTTRDTQSYLFPASQLGLALYMFVVGLEFRVDIIRDKFKSSIAVSIAGMATPFLLGALLAYYFYDKTELGLFPPAVPKESAMIFLGACMCITAFPMLARIIQFKGLGGTTMGAVAIGAGAIDDASAWCLLALVLAKIDNNWSQAYSNIGCGIAFVAIAILLIKPLLLRIEARLVRGERLTDAGTVVGLSLMCLGAWWTDYIHLHAVFGAFIIGSIIPRRIMAPELIKRIQPLTVILLLPLFFTYSGLTTQINLINSWTLCLVSLLILVAAVVGKGVACWLAALATGIPNRDAMGIGTLMNARGLMELIIINIGLQKGVISERMFAVLVIMAIVTTLMASPLFELLVAHRNVASMPQEDTYE